MTRQTVVVALPIVVALGLGVSAHPQLDDDTIYRVLPRDAITAIDDPQFESVAEADSKFARNELVIGLVGHTEQRAYSTWQLDRREIVNDVFEGRPVAITWCPLCGTGVVYNRTVENDTLTFGVSGMLFRDALVMFDRQTDTLWTHVDGRAIRGPLQGQVLTPVPSVHTTWDAWKRMYPESHVLKKHGRTRSNYESYNRNGNKLGIFGRRNVDRRLPGKERILGVRTETSAVAFPIEDVREAQLVQESIDQLEVLLVVPAPISAQDGTQRLNRWRSKS